MKILWNFLKDNQVYAYDTFDFGSNVVFLCCNHTHQEINYAKSKFKVPFLFLFFEWEIVLFQSGCLQNFEEQEN